MFNNVILGKRGFRIDAHNITEGTFVSSLVIKKTFFNFYLLYTSNHFFMKWLHGFVSDPTERMVVALLSVKIH